MTTTEQAAPPTPQEAEISRLVSMTREHGEPDRYGGKRGWVRYTIGMDLEVTTDADDPSACWPVVTHNISGGGIGFWSKRELPEESHCLVREHTKDGSAAWVSAWVAHCTIGIRGYLIGVAFADPLSRDDDAEVEARSVMATTGEAAAPVPPSPSTFRPFRRQSLGVKCACASALASGIGVVIAVFSLNHTSLDPVVLWDMIAGTVLAFGVAGLVGWAIVSSEVRFLEAFGRAVRGIAAGEVNPPSLGEAPSRELADLRRELVDLGSLWQQREDDGRIRQEKLEELNRIKSNILAIVSHDLRTPLTSILLYAKMLTEELETLAEEDQRRFLNIISEECTRLSRLVDDLLELQRLESGRAKWEIRAQDLSQTIVTCARAVEAIALSKSIKFEVECPDGLPAVEADPDKIAQVLSNLLSNAMKYTPSGGAVHLSAQSSGSSILIRVADTGPGIPRDKWEQIFDRFAQLSNPDVREIAGVGLGLHIVRQIVERHGGAVWVDSEVGRGSEFFVSLPIRATNVKTDAAPEMGSSAARVLVCDGDPELGAMIAQTLRSQDFEVRLAHSGCQLLGQLAQADVDVVVTDLLLPDMNAAELLDGLNDIESSSFRLVVHSYAGDGPELRRRGADVFLQRPASREDLVQAVQVAMRKRSAGGLAVLLVAGGGIDVGCLCTALSEHGYLPIVADTILAAADRIRDYPVDVVLLPGELVLGDWTKLEELPIAEDDDTQVMVMCETVRKRDRHLAEAYGVWLASYRPGAEEEVIASIKESRDTNVPEFSS